MRFYYGWLIVLMTMTIMMTIVGASANAYGMYVLPVSQEFDLSRADVNTGLIISNLGGAVMAPFLGRLIDTYPVRLVMIVCTAIFALGMIGLGLSHNIWLSATLLAVALPAGLAGVSQLGGMTLVARWFEAQRGRAMALAVMGGSLGSLVMAPIVGWMIDSFGWRQSLIACGIGIGGLILLMLAIIRTHPGPEDIEPRPASSGPAPLADAPVGKPMTGRDILAMPRFWLLAGGVALAMGCFQTIMITLVPIAQEGGVDVTKAATLISVLGGTAILGKVALVWVGDKINKALSLAIMFGLLSVMFFSLTLSEDFTSLFISSALLGLVVGATMPVFMALLADFIGAASFGTANGISMLLMSACGAIGMRFAGEVYDRTGGYDMMFLAFTAVCALATAFLTICWLTTRVRRVEPVTAG